MAYCDKCGVQVANDVRFCPACGFKLIEACEDSDNAKDTTTSYDVESNKAMAVLSYLGILVLVPLLGAKNSPFARFHTNQGLILCIATILYSVACTIINSIVLAISWRLYFITTLLSLVTIVFGVLAIIGIINAMNGRMKELPVIGRFRILK